MTVLTKSILIKVPVEKVFAYLDDPTAMLEFWPSRSMFAM